MSVKKIRNLSVTIHSSACSKGWNYVLLESRFRASLLTIFQQRLSSHLFRGHARALVATSGQTECRRVNARTFDVLPVNVHGGTS